MGSAAQNHQLPVINFTGKTSNSGFTSWISAREEVVRALEEYGCFIATYDKVPLELCQDILRASEKLFDLPTETKVLNTSDKPFHGYIGGQPILPLVEGFGIENATTFEGIQKFSNVIWPSENNNFSVTALSYSKLVAELNQMVMRMVSETYGVDKDCELLFGSMYYVLKLIKYRSPRENEKNIGIAPHTDKNFMTILHQGHVNGLEIKTRNGDWMLVDSLSPTAFVVLAGDVCTAWTNGRINAPYHRVITSGNAERYSVGLFAFMRDLTVEVPKELVDDEHPLQFTPFDPYKYLLFCTTEEGRRSGCNIKSYCGV